MIKIVGPHRQHAPHPEGFNLINVGISVRSDRMMFLILGIGWDEELPWSFKFAGNVKPVVNNPATYACVTWLGMFVGIAYEDKVR